MEQQQCYWRMLLLLATAMSIVWRLPVIAEAKVFERCELAQLLYKRHALPLNEVATWVCIAQHSSGFNTAAYGGSLVGGSHGLFQISDVFWCSPPGKGFGCNIPCERLRDDDLTDDLACSRIIHAEHQRISGDGFTAWNAYSPYCHSNTNAYIADCFAQIQLVQRHQPPVPVRHTPQTTNFVQQGFSSFGSSGGGASGKRGKVYSRCELAQELYYRHQLPIEEIPTWVCIAHHESNYDTAAVGRLNADGSADHGLFQISDLYWCDHDQRSGGKACGLPCSRLLDNDITDDVRCIRRIHNEHTRISGNGFTAWTVYNRDCRNQRYDQIASCFKQKTPQYTQTMPNVVAPQKHVASSTSFLHHAITPVHTHASSHASHAHAQTSQRFQANPFLNGAFAAHPTTTIPIPNSFPSQYHTSHHHPQPVHKINKAGKVYSRCELAQELYFKHAFSIQDIATWVCIAQHESNFDTAAVGRLNSDGSEDHGLFQISDLYWCTHNEQGGKGCNLPCNNLLDNDITDDVRCIRTIHDEHRRISGDGFTAWTVYPQHCRNQRIEQVANCFESSEVSKTQQIANGYNIQSTTINSSHSGSNNNKTGKIYNKCELAQELYFKHKMPMEQIPTWVCIAQHESNFNTAAIGRLNTDGSADHGLFQISDLYWCDHTPQGGKACNIPCEKLIDSDITDDVRCIQTIFEEHTRISGDGFTAWTVYPRNCRYQQLEQISPCFDTTEISKAQQIASSYKPKQSVTTIVKHHATLATQPKKVISQGSSFFFNPFLSQFVATAPSPTTSSSLQLQRVNIPKNQQQQLNFNANPFLQKYAQQSLKMSASSSTSSAHVQLNQPAAPMPHKKHTNAIEINSIPQFNSNPFLNKYVAQVSKASYEKPKTTIAVVLSTTTPRASAILSSSVPRSTQIPTVQKYTNSGIFLTTQSVVRQQESPHFTTNNLSTTPKTVTTSAMKTSKITTTRNTTTEHQMYANILTATSAITKQLTTTTNPPTTTERTTTTKPLPTTNILSKSNITPTTLKSSTVITAVISKPTTSTTTKLPTTFVGENQRNEQFTATTRRPATTAAKTAAVPTTQRIQTSIKNPKTTTKSNTSTRKTMSSETILTTTTRQPLTTLRNVTNGKRSATAGHVTITTRQPTTLSAKVITATQSQTKLTSKTTITKRPITIKSTNTTLIAKNISTLKTTTKRPTTTKYPTPNLIATTRKSQHLTTSTAYHTFQTSMSTTTVRTTNKAHTTRQSRTTINNTQRTIVKDLKNIQNTNKFKDDPFSHPFFAKYRQEFDTLFKNHTTPTKRPTTTTKPTNGVGYAYHQMRTSVPK